MPQTGQRTFDTTPYTPLEIKKPWGRETHLTPSDLPYMFKILSINAKEIISLQYHDQKQESWLLKSGKVKLLWQETEGGPLIETVLEEGMVYTCGIGQKHRLVAVTGCEVWEVSTPEIGTTFRLEDKYGRLDETPEEREKRDKQAKKL